MCLKFTVLLALMCLQGLAARGTVLQKRQVGKGAAEIDSEQDRTLAESEFLGLASQPAAAHGAESKYFQYIHMPAHDHYEHGHKRGDEHHFIERHEKGHPHAGEFKNKVRWGDKHGGYGEHYWDYNHAGHGGHESDGEESQHQESYEDFEETKDSPTIVDTTGLQRGKRQPTKDDDVEFINPQARALVLNSRAPKHGGNYQKAPETDWSRAKRQPFQKRSFDKVNKHFEKPPKFQFFDDGGRTKRQPEKATKKIVLTDPHNNLVFDTESGHIVDQTTGVHFQLQPVE